MTQRQTMQAQSALSSRIDSLAAGIGQAPLRALINDVDDIRTLAHDHGFATVECLASRLESEIARGGRRATVQTYVEAMGDAVRIDPAIGQAQQALLASVALRMNG